MTSERTERSLRLGIWLASRGWFVPGSWLLRRRLAEEPDDPELQLIVANCAAARGRGDEVRRVLGARRDPDALFVHVVLAVRARRRDEALAALAALASQTQPDDPLLLGAEDLVRELPLVAPVTTTGTGWLLRFGVLLLRIGAIRAARLVFARLCRSHPGDPELELIRATCEMQLGRHAAAAALLGSRRDPDALVCRIELAAIADQADVVAALVEDLWERTEEGDERRREAIQVLDERGAIVEWPDERVGAARSDG